MGGGPAGATLARLLAREGKDVLVIDKRKELGVPVRCGEALGMSELTKERIDLPRESYYAPEIAGAKVVAPNGKAIVWKNESTADGCSRGRCSTNGSASSRWIKGRQVRTYSRALAVLKDG